MKKNLLVYLFKLFSKKAYENCSNPKSIIKIMNLFDIKYFYFNKLLFSNYFLTSSVIDSSPYLLLYINLLPSSYFSSKNKGNSLFKPWSKKSTLVSQGELIK